MTTNNNWTLGEQDTVTAVFRRAVEARPNHCFIEFEDGTAATYREFDLLSNRLAHGLKDLNVQPGDTVSSLLDNNLECVVLWFAVNKLGAIWVPINNALKGEFLRHQVADSGAKLVVAEQEYCERFKLIEDKLEHVTILVYRTEKPESSFDRLQLTALASAFSDDDSALADTNKPSDLSMLIYTSGTTGPSKGCMMSHNYACSLARLSQSSAARNENDINWSCLPLFHFNATASTVLATVLTQGRCYFVPRFSLSQFWKSIRNSGATVVNIIGQMVPLIAKQDDCEDSKACYGQVRSVVALPFDEELQKIWLTRFGVEIAGANCYGLSEASLLTSLPAGEVAKPGSSGRRNDLFDVLIIDDEGNELAAGEAGEVVCRPRKANIIFDGYWCNPGKTLEIMQHMWLHTGDIGKFDEDGFFFFVDRKKDYLRRGGENISSYEVEGALLQHPDIQEVAVHSVLSELSEDEVKATIVLIDGATISEEQLCIWSVDHLPYYAVPRYIEYRASLPINPLNKVMKYELRDEGVTANTWDRSNTDINIKKR